MTTETVPDDASALYDSMAADKPTASLIFVAPDTAQRWLSKNDRNRRLNNETVSRYVRDMNNGDWEFTGEAVKFADDGRLLDGQHRLTALVEHGSPILMLVVRGLTQRAQDVMDTGRKRSASDMFVIADRENASLLAATVRLAVAWKDGKITTSDSQFFGQISNSQIRDMEANDPLIKWAVQVASRVRTDIPANPAAIAFAAWLMGYCDSTAAVQFLNSVAEMRTEGVGDPRFTLIKRLTVAKTNRERLTSVQQAFYIVKAWNAWRTGSTLKTIKASTSAGPSAFPDPV